jgi:hypothetical protein
MAESAQAEAAAADALLVPAAKITCEVYKSLAPQAEAALAALGVDRVQQHSRRALALRERAAVPFLAPTLRLDEDPAEVYEFYLPRSQAQSALLAWARALRLFTAGRGSIYAEEVRIVSAAQLDMLNTQVLAVESALQPDEHLPPLVLLNCVVQRGRGNDLARCALEAGTSVPSINFGVGTGVRDRLGLLRIAIPADKEIVSLLVEAHEQQEMLEMLIEAGRLDEPGRGFIAAYAVPFGVRNPRGLRGRQRHSASMDQIIAAIDHLSAGTHWRRRGGEAQAGPRRELLRDLVNLNLSCSEGSSEAVLEMAMLAGAGGATISRSQHFSPSGRRVPAFPGRELIDLGLRPQQLPGLLQSLRDSGAFGDEVACFVEAKDLPAAFTYVAA